MSGFLNMVSLIEHQFSPMIVDGQFHTQTCSGCGWNTIRSSPTHQISHESWRTSVELIHKTDPADSTWVFVQLTKNLGPK